ncbi:MAG: endonuclease/exonuclease/phosphatase family protein [Bacteroidales bacterium]|nr:endonuclease/exonuclease/phosphatase family protein [Bacteroidales bacterium]
MKNTHLFRLLFFAFMLACMTTNAQEEIRVMTFNIRLDHAGDGQHNWRFRKEAAAELLSLENVDIVGTQEVLKNQLNDFLSGAPAFASIGVGRFDGDTLGEYSAILYRKARFEVLHSGNFWLSETPDVAGSKGWDAACERIVTWAVMKDLVSNKTFVFMNTHFDHIGHVARKNSAIMLVEKAKQIAGDLPLILTGDFNGNHESDPIQVILKSGWLHDSGQLTAKKSGPKWSFHDFGRLPIAERELIDFIFVTDGIQVNSYKNIFKEIGKTFYSDHNPILVELVLKSYK